MTKLNSNKGVFVSSVGDLIQILNFNQPSPTTSINDISPQDDIPLEHISLPTEQCRVANILSKRKRWRF